MTLKVYTCPGCKQRHYGRHYWSNKEQPDHYCSHCHEFSQPKEVSSTMGLRCPMCGATECDDLWEHDGLYNEGGHEITCMSCDFDYRVSVAIEVTFTSPERITIHHGENACEEDETWMPKGDRAHRFQCIDCKRWCCACFGDSEELEVAEPDKGTCDDCWVKKEKRMSEQEFKMKLCIDFDGVIHLYTSGWKGFDVVADGPVPGAIDWLKSMIDDPTMEPMIYSSRSKEVVGINAMRAWLVENGLTVEDVEKLQWPMKKPAAWLTIDDRGFHFEGTFPSSKFIREFKPWNKK